MSIISPFSPNTSPLTTITTTTTTKSISFPSQRLSFNTTRHKLLSPTVISVTSPSISHFKLDYLEGEFSRHGVSFKELGGSYVVKMVLEDGSSASLLLPTGLITSYKPKMWHGTTVEVLHTSVSDQAVAGGSAPVAQGGVSLALDCQDESGFSWSPTTWVLTDVKGSSQDSIQVEIISRDSENLVEVKHKITLKQDSLSSEIIISNSKPSQLNLTGSILSHLNVSTPDATYAFGLEGSNFFNRPPLVSDLCIIPPILSKNKEAGYSQLWPLTSIKRLFDGNRDESETSEEIEGEEKGNYKHLTDNMSRIYTSAPRSFTIIDRGKRNSVIIGRKGFEELYIYSPGSSHECYGKYAYICVGQSAILKPITLGPTELWIGKQQLRNPNV